MLAVEVITLYSSEYELRQAHLALRMKNTII